VSGGVALTFRTVGVRDEYPEQHGYKQSHTLSGFVVI